MQLCNYKHTVHICLHPVFSFALDNNFG